MYTITILIILALVLCLGVDAMYHTVRMYRTPMVEKNSTPAPLVGLDYRMFPALVDLMETFTSPWEDEADYVRHGLTKAEADALDALDDECYAQQLNDSINAYEEEMDLEWEDEIMGYTLSDIVEFMVLDSEDDPYEDLPFTASMRRSAKVGKSGINYVLNCGAERSIHNAGDKVRK